MNKRKWEKAYKKTLNRIDEYKLSAVYSDFVKHMDAEEKLIKLEEVEQPFQLYIENVEEELKLEEEFAELFSKCMQKFVELDKMRRKLNENI